MTTISAFAGLGRLWRSLQTPEFSAALPITDKGVLRELQRLLEPETGTLQRVYDVTLDDADTFKGRADQRITLGRSQTYEFTITPDQMIYRLVNAEAIATFAATEAGWSEVVEFRMAGQSTKKLNCKPGNIQCGGKCQNGSKNCFANMTPAQKKAAKATVGKAKATQPPPRPGSVAELDPSAIAVDAQRFQYKIIGQQTKTGEVGSLSGVKRWDENLAGIIQVWNDPADGKTYVVNGHNRLALAQKLGAETVTVRYLNVKDAAEARAVGALTNIAEGRGNALDAAKFFRDTGLSKDDLDQKGIPMRERIAQDGLALSRLDDSLFRKAIDGDIPIERATIIGGSGLDHQQQRSLVTLIDRQRRNVTNEVLTELIDGVKASQQQVQTQFDLFGGSQVVVDNAIERATLQAAIKRRLSRERNLFGTVGNQTAAQQLASAGNVIDVNQSQQVSRQAAQALGVFDQLKNQTGAISRLLNDAATTMQQGGDRRKVEAQLYRDILQTIQSGSFAEEAGE